MDRTDGASDMGDDPGFRVLGDALGKARETLAHAAGERGLRNLDSRTVLVDLDGVICRHSAHHGWYAEMEILPGVRERLAEWWNAGHTIVIITGRPECLRPHTEIELSRKCVFYHKLVMGVGSGRRILINDAKPYAPEEWTAQALTIPRDAGLEGVKL